MKSRKTAVLRAIHEPSRRLRVGRLGAIEERHLLSSRLYVGGITSGTTQETLRAWLEGHGLLVQAVHVVYNQATGLGRGFAFVDVGGEAHAIDGAIAALAGDRLDGRVPCFKSCPVTDAAQRYRA